jgi:predicted nucleic acid-binding protein
VALIKRDDPHHGLAKRISASLVGALVVTSDAVLIELLSYVCESGELLRARAGEFVSRALDGATDLQVIEQDRDLFRVALERYRKRADKGYSLVDCMSMCIMDKQSIANAITDDHHFEQERFVAVREPINEQG